jgi:hypothetical protein
MSRNFRSDGTPAPSTRAVLAEADSQTSASNGRRAILAGVHGVLQQLTIFAYDSEPSVTIRVLTP